MNIPKSAIAPFEPLGIPVLNTMEPPLHDWQEDLIHRIRRAPTRNVWYTRVDEPQQKEAESHGWTAGPAEDSISLYAPYLPLDD